MVQRGNCSWAVDTYKVAVDTVARGAVEATGMQIQFINIYFKYLTSIFAMYRTRLTI